MSATTSSCQPVTALGQQLRVREPTPPCPRSTCCLSSLLYRLPTSTPADLEQPPHLRKGPVRILRIANVPDNRTGGMSRAMHFTGDEMRRRGHEVSFLSRPELAPRDVGKLERFTVPLRVPRVVGELARSGRCFDVVEIHEPLAAAYCVARRWNKALPPVVVFSHGLEERGYAAEMAYLRLKSRPITLKFRLSPRTQIAQAEYAVRHADHVLCCSEEDRRYLFERGVPAERLTRHQNGVSNAFLEATGVEPPPHRGGVLFMGSWLLRKGILETIEA